MTDATCLKAHQMASSLGQRKGGAPPERGKRDRTIARPASARALLSRHLADFAVFSGSGRLERERSTSPRTVLRDH